MCDWCDENNGEPIGCQNCGRMICWDNKAEDDVFSRPYVTASGDVYCVSCGARMDQEEEDAIEDEGYYNDYTDGWYDPDMDFENEESNGVYIGEDEPPSEQNGIAF
jgi:hypothetical protein